MLRVSVLGEQAIVDDETGVRTRSARAVALVAFLAWHAGSAQPRQRIAGLFWPESTDAQALTNLRRELHHLRQVLGDDCSPAVTPTDLRWRDTETCRVDLRAFGIERAAALAAVAAGDDEGAVAHATRAMAEYRGDLLPGVYDDWLAEARSQLERQCVDLCDLACEAQARRGDLAGAVAAARRRIELQPLEEVGYRTLMRLQAGLGDRAGAVSTYHHCASVLERELGIVPDPQTRQAFESLIADPGPRGTRRPANGTAAGRPGRAAARLVGRSQELGQLRELWRAATAGHPGLVLVRGGPGVGKTRLVSEIAELARRQGAVVASSQCFGTPGRLALAPVADWMRHPVVQGATATLGEAWRAEVGRLVPSGDQGPPAWGRGPSPWDRGPQAAAPRVAADTWQRHRFFEGLARGLLAVGGPMLLVLDNVQWCDQETLAFVPLCLRLAQGAPLMVAGTLRDDGPGLGPGVGEWIDRMRATGLLTELSLRPFEAAETARLAEAISGRRLRDADTDLLQATTGGFPLYVIEAVRGIADSADADPGSAADPTNAADPGAPADAGGAADPGGRAFGPAGDLTAVLRNRLTHATAAAREVAGLAAAVGTDFTLDLLTEASDLEAGIVVEAVDELWRRRIVRELGDGYDFSHDLLRETAYAQVSPPKRWLLHRRVAQGLELLHADNTDHVAAQLAEQYARGGRRRRAVTYYRRAAEVAAGMFAHAEAIRLHREALSIIGNLSAGADRDSCELAVLEAMAAPLNARYGYASPDLQRAVERSVDLAESLGRTDSTLTGLASLWGVQFVQGRHADGYQTAIRVLALADRGSELSGPAHFTYGGAALSLGMPAEGVHHLELASRKPGGSVALSIGTRTDVHSTAWAAHAHWLLGHDDAARAACRDAIKLARAIDHPYSLAVALSYGGITYQMLRDLPRLRETVGELRELCDRYGFAYYREWALVLDGWSRPGGSGIDLARQGIGNLRSEGAFARMPYWLSLLADVLARQRQPDAARATLDGALVDARARDDLWWLPEVMRMRAGYDEDQAAVARLRSAARMASAHGSVALVRRCEHDLAGRDVRRRDLGVLPTA
jgi:DNA-binding SARP family transcriptional activator/tetratricopeptide (TPR) repeat protein